MTKFRKMKKLVRVREPNGKPSRTHQESDYAPTRVKWLREAAMAGMQDARWGTELGRLNLAGKITDEMFGAGQKWSEKAKRYHSAMEGPPIDCKAIPLERCGRASPPDPDSPDGIDQAVSDLRAVLAMQEAHAVLISGAGTLAERQVRATCEHNECPDGAAGLAALRSGLLWLAQFWGLTRDRKSGRVR